MCVCVGVWKYIRRYVDIKYEKQNIQMYFSYEICQRSGFYNHL